VVGGVGGGEAGSLILGPKVHKICVVPEIWRKSKNIVEILQYGSGNVKVEKIFGFAKLG
jgi:hypothetical protein